jgi:hypothetical protein
MNIQPDKKAIRRDFDIVGKRTARPDGIDKVTGRARFGADMTMPGMLWGLVLRSPHAHARIKRIDTSRAEKLNGVHAIVTAKDFGPCDDSLLDIRENVMARGKALYDGHAVAAVAAVSKSVARQALKLIEVEYKVLPHVTDVDEAMKPDAPVINEKLFTKGLDNTPSRSHPTLPSVSSLATATSRRALPKQTLSSSAPSGPRPPTRATSSRTPALPRWGPMAVARCGCAPKATSWCATPAPAFSALTCRTCASPPRKSAAALAARPRYSSSRWRWPCRSRQTVRSRW